MNTKIDAELNYSIPNGLEYRIQDDIDVYEGHLPRRLAIAWKAYLASLMEWEVIALTDYNKLLELLPALTDDPVPDILSSKERLNSRGESLDIVAELQCRIQKDIDARSKNLPEAYAIAWKSYLASLMEWQVISGHDYKQLIELLPQLSNPNPVLEISSGRMDAYAFQEYIKEDTEAFRGNLPERNTIAWKAYLRGLWEYGAISTKVYQQLLRLLPTTIDLEELNIFSERGQMPKSPGIGVSAQVSAQLRDRIQQQLNDFQGYLPENYLIVWKAYLLSLEYWSVIEWSDYSQLVNLLSPISSPDPVQRIASRSY